MYIMKIILDGTPKEVVSLVLAIQEQQKGIRTKPVNSVSGTMKQDPIIGKAIPNGTHTIYVDNGRDFAVKAQQSKPQQDATTADFKNVDILRDCIKQYGVPQEIYVDLGTFLSKN